MSAATKQKRPSREGRNRAFSSLLPQTAIEQFIRYVSMTPDDTHRGSTAGVIIYDDKFTYSHPRHRPRKREFCATPGNL